MRLRTKRVSNINKDSKIYGWLIRLAILLVIIIVVRRVMNLPFTNEFRYINLGIPTAFNGSKIVHISDLNNSNINIASRIKKIEPEIIIISGGIADSNGNYQNSAKIVSKLTSIAPVYVMYSENDINSGVNLNGVNVLDSNGIDVFPVEKDASTFIANIYGSDMITEYNRGNEETINFVNGVLEEYKSSLENPLRLYGLKDENNEMLNNTTFNISVINGTTSINDKSKKYINMLLVGGLEKKSDYKYGWYNNNGTDIFITSGIKGNKSIVPQVQVISLYNVDYELNNPLERLLSKFIKKVDAKHTSDRLNIGHIKLDSNN